MSIVEAIDDCPVIAAVRDIRDIESAIESKSTIIFMLCGNIMNIEEIIRRIKVSGKYVCVHLDLVEGLGRDSSAVKFLHKVGADGIITTKASLLKDIRAAGLYSILRLFMVDSRSLETGIKNILDEKPCAVEIMPVSAASVIRKINEKSNISIIAGGLAFEKSEVIDALSKGAVAVSTSCYKLWEE